MTTRVRRITVGAAIVGAHDPVLSTALDLVREGSAELHVVHVYDTPPAIVSGGRTPARPRQEGVRRRLEERVRDLAGDAPVVCHAVEGTPSEELIRVSREVGADLVVVGTTRRDRVGRHYLGTTARGVASHATQPVLLLRQPVLRPLRSVLFPVDLSDLSAAVLQAGVEIVRDLFGPDDPEHEGLLVVEDPGADGADARAVLLKAEECLADFLSPWREAGVRVRGRVREGDPAEQIVDALDALRSDLLVLGTHSHRKRYHDLGSVAGATLREARCNALVIPAIHAEGRLVAPEGAGAQPASRLPHPAQG